MSVRDDLRTALRSLARRPGFAAVVVLTLAVALGANTAVFSVLQQTVLQPLPHPGAEGAVYVFRENAQAGFQVTPMLEQVRRWRERARSLDRIEGFDTTRVTLLGRGEPRRLRAAQVTPGLFDLLGVAPALGRGFEDGSEERVAIVSHGLWRELFGGDPAALGETLRLGEEVYTVVGVMPRGFRFVPPVRAELWFPIPEDPGREVAPITLARLAPGVGPEAAAEELAALERHAASAAGGEPAEPPWTPRIQGLGALFGEDLGRALVLLQAAVGLMVLIACANIGNLFLIRAEGRSREIAVRTALGAGRDRVAGCLLLESVLLAAAGSLLGLLFARWGGGLVTALHGGSAAEVEALRLDAGLFAFTAGAGLVAALAFGLVPALTASRTDLTGVLQAGRGAAGASVHATGGGRLRSALVVAEVSLALVLLVGAGLLTKSFLGLATADPGFAPDGVVAVSVNLPQERYAEAEYQRSFLRELRAALEASGLEDAALASTPPTLAAIYFGRHLTVEGREPLPEGLVDMVSMVGADPGYFRTLGMRFAAGGPFTRRALESGAGEERPIVVNRSLARVLWPGGGALGERLKLGTAEDEPWSRVVGVIEDTAQLGLATSQDTFQMYLPLRRVGRVSILVRAPGVEPAVVGERVAGLVRTVDPWLPVAEAVTVRDLLGSSVAEERFEMALMLVFAAISLVLTVLGVYAVLAYLVRLRTFEIGVRSALGATPDQVLGLVARQGALLVALGLALGLAASLALGRLVEGHLHDVPARDPAVLASAVALLAATTALATVLPARRAARLDPAEVLRAD